MMDDEFYMHKIEKVLNYINTCALEHAYFIPHTNNFHNMLYTLHNTIFIIKTGYSLTFNAMW